MPDIKPGESKEQYLNRCIPVLIEEGKSASEAVAVCASSYEDFEKSMMEKTAFSTKAKILDFYAYENPEDFQIDDEVILKQGEELRLVLGIVLEPETVDLQEDIYSADEIRKTAHNFMADYHGQGNGFMHNSKGEKGLRIVESYLAPIDMVVNKEKIKKGTWLMGTMVLDDKIWEMVKNGKITGYSVGGKSNAKPA